MDNDMINDPTATERMRSVIETMASRLANGERVSRREAYSALSTLGALLDEVDATLRTLTGMWLSKISVDDDAEDDSVPVFTAMGTDDLVVADAGRFDVVGRRVGDDTWEVSTVEFGSGVSTEVGTMTAAEMQDFANGLYASDDLV